MDNIQGIKDTKETQAPLKTSQDLGNTLSIPLATTTNFLEKLNLDN